MALPPLPDLDLRTLFRLFKDQEGTDTQVESGIKCYVKPNRTERREFTSQDAARISCLVIKAGKGTAAEIRRRMQVICPDEAREKRGDFANVAEEAIALAIENSNLMSNTLLDEYRAFLIVNGLLLGIVALLGVIQLAGPLRVVALPLRTGARVAQVQVAQLIQRNIVARAANDANFQRLTSALRQAA